MTVSYTDKVANSKNFGAFPKLLLRWRGSIYKLVWPDLLIFLTLFFALSLLYRVALNETQQRIFESLAVHCEKYASLIPVSFVLGFYVSIVVGRWWQQYLSIPWIDTLAIWVNTSVGGNEEKDRLLRRTIVRYACLAITQCFTLISPRVKKRFPTLEHLVEAGLLLENEKELMAEIRASSANGAKYPTHWIPLVWAAGIVTRARSQDKIKADATSRAMMDEIYKIKDQCQLLISFDWISVPLVYTQVVTLAVYVYFFSCLMGKQWLRRSVEEITSGKLSDERLDLVFPVFTVLQFFFYMGWLKVAESLLNPFGDDDDDFELNWIVDRNLQVAYIMVDDMRDKNPELLKDQYWNDIVPPELPHTVASEKYKEGPPIHSTDNISLTRDGSVILPPSHKSSSHFPESYKGTTSCEPDVDNKIRSNPGSSISVHSRGSSSNSKLFHVGSFRSAFRRIMSKERKMNEDGEEGGSLHAMPSSSYPDHDVIPELDENMISIVSGKSGKPKPTVQEIFGDVLEKSKQVCPPTSYDAMTVNNSTTTQNQELDPLFDVTTICLPK